MDWKEALEGLRELIDPLCTDDQFDYEEEIEKAIEALEKQIPKEPTVTGEVNFSCWCPSCKSLLDFGEKYCGFCGQAISSRLW